MYSKLVALITALLVSLAMFAQAVSAADFSSLEHVKHSMADMHLTQSVVESTDQSCIDMTNCNNHHSQTNSSYAGALVASTDKPVDCCQQSVFECLGSHCVSLFGLMVSQPELPFIHSTVAYHRLIEVNYAFVLSLPYRPPITA